MKRKIDDFLKSKVNESIENLDLQDPEIKVKDEKYDEYSVRVLNIKEDLDKLIESLNYDNLHWTELSKSNEYKLKLPKEFLRIQVDTIVNSISRINNLKSIVIKIKEKHFIIIVSV